MNAEQSTKICEICLDDHNNPEDRLATCEHCKVSVHQSCYGGSILEQMPEGSWVCEKCRYQNIHPDEEIGCKFCPLNDRGALKRLSLADSKGYFWAHVQCVNWIPEIHFSSEEYAKNVNLL